MLITTLRTIAALAALTFPVAATPNFSGHWKLNAEKSKLDEPYQEERTIDHKDPQLTVSSKASVDGEEEESTVKYRTDGQRTRNMIDGDPPPIGTAMFWYLIPRSSATRTPPNSTIVGRFPRTGSISQCPESRRSATTNESSSTSSIWSDRD
jgi:hypothetical protein